MTLCGGNGNEDGATVVKKIEEKVGVKLARDFVVEPGRGKGEKQSKLGAFWDGIRERMSWKKIYDGGVY